MSPRQGFPERADVGHADVDALLSRAIHATATGVTIVDAQRPNMPLIFVNEAFQQITGYRRSEVLGANCRFLQGPDTDVEDIRAAREALAAGVHHVGLLLNYRKDGSPWWNELRLSPVRDGDGTLTHYFGFQSDVTARVEAEKEVARLATHDPLTGLPNRAGFFAGLDDYLTDAARSGGQIAVLFIDLDGFKQVNDSLGHEVGDDVLAAVAGRVRETLGDTGLLGRLSGDEFVAVVPGVGNGSPQDIVHRVTADILDAFRAPHRVSGREISIGASIGVALFPHHGRSSQELMGAADVAMYAAKKSGRGRAALALPHPGTEPDDYGTEPNDSAV
ncbi:MAG: diguanylate cyclase domain-containing protein [Rhodococcus sp. (in: high G+C Gram-positive bacteria)]